MDPVDLAAIPPQYRVSAAAKHALPSVRLGYLLAIALLIVQFGEYLIDSQVKREENTILSTLILYANFGYFLFFVYRMHLVVGEATNGNYPIGPIKATLLSLIPLFNLYWIFHWIGGFSDFVNSHKIKRISKHLPAIILLLSFFVPFVPDMIDAFNMGRANRPFSEAWQYVEQVPRSPTSVMWAPLSMVVFWATLQYIVHNVGLVVRSPGVRS